MEKRTCPFCNSELTVEHKIVFCDFFCNRKDHFFSERMVDVKDTNGDFIKEDGKQVKELVKIKLSLRDRAGEKMYLKINYDEGTSQVWTKDSTRPRATINNVFVPDYNNPDSILQKIKTYLLFS